MSQRSRSMECPTSPPVAPRGREALRGDAPHASRLCRQDPAGTPIPTATGGPALGGVFLSLVLLAAVKQSLAWLGFARTIGWVRGRSVRSGPRPVREVSLATIAAREREVAVAAAFYPGRALCLERSLALQWRLRRIGADVELRFGVQTHPFAAHAWVAHHGVPVNDSEEHVQHFTVVPELPV